jgi:hypothetical protein
MTNFHSPAYRAMDIYADQADDLYADIITDHDGMTEAKLQTRIAISRDIANDPITYGLNRSRAAKRIGEHAAMVLSMRKVARVAA